MFPVFKYGRKRVGTWFEGKCCVDESKIDVYRQESTAEKWQEFIDSGKGIESGTATVIAARINAGVQLVMHEDRLNWQKLYNLVYIELGLLAAYLLIAQADTREGLGQAAENAHSIIGLLGIAFGWGFCLTLWSGVSCLSCHKSVITGSDKALIGIEHLLRDNLELGAGNENEPPSTIFYAKQGPTRVLIRWTPILFIGMWVGLLACRYFGAIETSDAEQAMILSQWNPL
jgi:hypothetical protein